MNHQHWLLIRPSTALIASLTDFEATLTWNQSCPHTTGISMAPPDALRLTFSRPFGGTGRSWWLRMLLSLGSSHPDDKRSWPGHTGNVHPLVLKRCQKSSSKLFGKPSRQTQRFSKSFKASMTLMPLRRSPKKQASAFLLMSSKKLNLSFRMSSFKTWLAGYFSPFLFLQLVDSSLWRLPLQMQGFLFLRSR